MGRRRDRWRERESSGGREGEQWNEKGKTTMSGRKFLEEGLSEERKRAREREIILKSKRAVKERIKYVRSKCSMEFEKRRDEEGRYVMMREYRRETLNRN